MVVNTHPTNRLPASLCMLELGQDHNTDRRRDTAALLFVGPSPPTQSPASCFSVFSTCGAFCHETDQTSYTTRAWIGCTPEHLLSTSRQVGSRHLYPKPGTAQWHLIPIAHCGRRISDAEAMPPSVESLVLTGASKVAGKITNDVEASGPVIY